VVSTASAKGLAAPAATAKVTEVLGAGGIFRLGGVMTITTSPITGNTPNNCVGSSPAVPSCTN
jgi:hypothetical protein